MATRIVAAALLAVLGFTGGASADKGHVHHLHMEKTVFFPAQKPSIASGKVVYEKFCAACHGDSGRGDGPAAAALTPKPTSFADSLFNHSVHEMTHSHLFDSVTHGVPPMPAFGMVLTEAQRWDATAYVWALSTTPDRLRDGQEVYRKFCAGCHGGTGRGDGPAGKGIRRMPDFTDPKWMSGVEDARFFKGISRGLHGPVASWGGQLSEQERWNVVDYIRSLTHSE